MGNCCRSHARSIRVFKQCILKKHKYESVLATRVLATRDLVVITRVLAKLAI